MELSRKVTMLFELTACFRYIYIGKEAFIMQTVQRMLILIQNLFCPFSEEICFLRMENQVLPNVSDTTVSA